MDNTLAGMGVTVLQRTEIIPGEHGLATMPHSEVCMYLRVAGTRMRFVFLGRNEGVQLLDENDRQFSFPILPGEAGIYERNGTFYYYR